MKTAVVAFLAALWAPLIGMFWGVGNFSPADENRNLAPRRQFTAYFHDHFGFRGTLITAQALFKVRVLGVSSSPEVVLGKDGWLFFTGDRSIDNHLGALPFRGDELEGWVRLFHNREAWLAGRGARLIVAIAPDKLSVYPEFLPCSLGTVKPQTRLDVFEAAMRKFSNTPLLDLRPALLASKVGHGRLYYPADTHWTARGAYEAYLAIVREIAKTEPGIQPVPFPNLPSPKLRAGDLVRMLGLGQVWRDVPEDQPWPRELSVTKSPDGDLMVNRAGGGAGRLAVFGDSFSYALIPYLAQNFRQTLVSRSERLNPDAIAALHPNVVLFEMAERRLNDPALQDPY